MLKVKTLFTLFLVCIGIIGCANSSVRYSEQNKPLAEQGKIKWSDYYKGLYDTAARSGGSGQGQFLSRINTMILAAQSYESGKLTRDQFDYLRREAQAGQAMDDEAANNRMRAALAAAAKSMADSSAKNAESGYKIVQPTPTTTTNTTCNAFGGQVNCTSRTQ